MQDPNFEFTNPSWSSIQPSEHKLYFGKKEELLTKHPLFKPHKKVDSSQFTEEYIQKLPVIYTHDLGARYCSADVGDIIEITRSKDEIYYRLVVAKKF